MDDSLEAFQLPSLTMRKHFSVVRKKQDSVLSNTINVESNNKAQGKQQQQDNTAKKIKLQDISSLESNATLSEIAEIKDEISNDICLHTSSQQVKAGKNKKILLSNPACQNSTERIESCLKHISQSGLCNLCKMVIPKNMCEMHHLQCFQKKYSSYNIKIDLQTKFTCTLCKQEIDISLYESHFTKCKQSLKDSETVTSSYFQPPVVNMQTSLPKKKILCPTCSLDLTGQNITTKQSHVNRCLDSKSSGNSKKTPFKKSVFKCQQCDKTLKTKANLCRHIQSCSECNDPNSSNATKCRVKSLKARRKCRNKPARSQEEELIKIAKAISKSEADEEKRKKKQEKLKYKEQAIPVMLQKTIESRKLALEHKFVEIISYPNKDNVDDNEVPSTPMLPITSKWSKPFSPVSNQTLGDNSFDVVDETLNEKSLFGCKSESSLCKETNATSSPQTGICKWQLTRGLVKQQPSTASTYKVTGLLSQFENGSSGFNKICATPTAQCSADQQTKILDEKMQSKDNIDQTLNQLKDLDQSIEQDTKRQSFLSNADSFPKTGVENCCNQETQSLQCDMKCLVNCRLFSDITLQVFDEFEKVHDIFAHKCIIFARFPNFLKILEEGICEKGVYTVTQCKLAQLMPLLTYIYTGCLGGESKIEINSILMKFGTTLRSSENNIYASPKTISTNVASEDDLFFNPVSPESLNCEGQSQYLSDVFPMDIQDFTSEKSVSMNEDSERNKNKRVLVHFTPLENKRLSKVRRMTGSTPKSPPGNNCQLPLDSPVDIGDMSSIVAFSPFSSPTLKGNIRSNSVQVTDFSHFGESEFEFKQGNCIYNTSLTQPINKSEKQDQGINANTNSVSENSNISSEIKLNQSNKTESDIHQRDNESTKSNLMLNQTSENTLSSVALSKDLIFQSPSGKLDQHCKTDKEANFPGNLSYSNDTVGQNCSFSECCATNSALLSAAVNRVIPSEHMFQTPKSHKNTNKSLSDVQFTPIPGYSDMDTPEIVRQGQTIGLKRTLGKKKLKIKLKEMYAYRHQVASSSDEDDTAAVGASPTYTNKDRIQRMDAEKQTNEAILVLEQYPLQEVVCEIFSSDEDETSVIGSDVEVLHSTLFPDMEPNDIACPTGNLITASQTESIATLGKRIKLSSSELDQLLHKLIASEVQLHSDILRYKPVYVSRFKELLTRANFRCTAADLLQYLTKQCITFSTADERKDKVDNVRRPKKPKKL